MKTSNLIVAILVTLMPWAGGTRAETDRRPPAERSPQRLVMKVMTAAQKAEATRVLGKEFMDPEGAFPPELRSSGGDVDAEGSDLTAVVQMAQCSNHACTFAFTADMDGRVRKVAEVESWSTPYLVYGQSQMKDIVYFDHLTNDCMACSSPTPVRLVWSEAKGKYVPGPRVLKKDYPLYPMKWDR